MKVLIIDDDEDLRNILAHYLTQEWPELEVEQFDPLARDMPDAGFPLGSYDVIILDYMLGRGDGLDWLQQFKQRPDCPPVLFLTGAGNEVIAVRAMKTGADDYQRKQELTRERLVSSVRELVMVKLEKSVTPAIAARVEGHELGARIQIPGIQVLRLIGEGGMSRVYLASREGDDEPLVVKILRPEVTSALEALAANTTEDQLDLAVIIAHELIHVCTNSGSHFREGCDEVDDFETLLEYALGTRCGYANLTDVVCPTS